MQRLIVPQEQLNGIQARIEGEDAHHLIRVLRAKPGDRFLVSDGAGKVSDAVAVAFTGQTVTLELEGWRNDEAESRIRVWIAQSLPKADKMDWIVQKGTEIGAAGFWPFLSSRTVVQYDAGKEAKRLERWRKIAKEAAEQAHRGIVPDVLPPFDWPGLLKQAAGADAAFLCYEQERGQGLRPALREALRELAAREVGADTVVQEKESCSIAILIGPEGGFSPEEVEEAIEAGIRPVGLGPRILRTETAAMVALGCIFYETGEMGG